ncbi:SCO family protein [Virgibacillus oceani]|uniref:Uncharacterized protein n=1 Tax=Virgibacillus oceani TaxID=1479511 RepID=A0A917HDT2_9BACI|nr:SCO family protein [Virgibacillus oceani]GGG75786.1 hypothetical protein GCM10011398_20850 [Virgibacillus oceani]
MTKENFDALLVSFSVDPDRDTPEVLKEFAEGYQADFSNRSLFKWLCFSNDQRVFHKII